MAEPLSISQVLMKNLAEQLEGMTPERMATLIAIAGATQKLSGTAQDTMDRLRARWEAAQEDMKNRRVSVKSSEYQLHLKMYLDGIQVQADWEKRILASSAKMVEKISS